MQSLGSQINLEAARTEIEELSFWLDGSGAEMAIRPGAGLPVKTPTLLAAVAEIARLRGLDALHMMINKLPGGVHVPKHRDWLPPTKHQEKPVLERWHLPISTNPDAYWWDEISKQKLWMSSQFWWGPVNYWNLHSVGNGGDDVRVHLVVDLDSPKPIGHYHD